MNNDLIIAELVLQILDNGSLDLEHTSIKENLKIESPNTVEVLNALLVSHKQRYLTCFNESQQSQEIARFICDYHSIFDHPAISDDLLRDIFLLSACQNYKNKEFREVCVHIMSCIDDCKIQEIRHAIYQKIVSAIVFCRLYIEEPYLSILRNARDALNSLIEQFGSESNTRLLE